MNSTVRRFRQITGIITNLTELNRAHESMVGISVIIFRCASLFMIQKFLRWYQSCLRSKFNSVLCLIICDIMSKLNMFDMQLTKSVYMIYRIGYINLIIQLEYEIYDFGLYIQVVNSKHKLWTQNSGYEIKNTSCTFECWTRDVNSFFQTWFLN